MYKIYFIPFIFLITAAYSQHFSQDIVVDYPIPTQRYKAAPAIDLDDNGNLGILWNTGGPTHDIVRFVKSNDGGQTFGPKVVVDSILYDPDEVMAYTPFVIFDYLANPLTFYCREIFYPFYHRVKKSLTGGNSFTTGYLPFPSRQRTVNFLFYDDTTGFLAYVDDYGSSRNIKVRKSIDGGLTYVNSTYVNTGNLTPARTISLVKCGNGDILCFYTTGDKACYNRSTDGGITFSNKVIIDTLNQYTLGVYAAAYQNYCFIVYSAANVATDHRILFKRSTDYGYTFSPAKVIYDFGGILVNSHPSPYIEYNPHVGICAIWTRYIGYATVFFTHSGDMGDTFDSTVVVSDSSAKWLQAKSMAVSDSGDIYVVSVLMNGGTNDRIVLNKGKLPFITDINAKNEQRIRDFELLQNYPNPFNIQTNIPFTLSHPEQVKLEIYDIVGRKICTVVNSRLNAGNHQVKWDGRDDFGRAVGSGIYFYRIQAGNSMLARKLLLMK